MENKPQGQEEGGRSQAPGKKVKACEIRHAAEAGGGRTEERKSQKRSWV